jgi:hypothetical protein
VYIHYSADAQTCIHGMSALFAIFYSVLERGAKEAGHAAAAASLSADMGHLGDGVDEDAGHSWGGNPWSPASRLAARRCRHRACP